MFRVETLHRRIGHNSNLIGNINRAADRRESEFGGGNVDVGENDEKRVEKFGHFDVARDRSTAARHRKKDRDENKERRLQGGNESETFEWRQLFGDAKTGGKNSQLKGENVEKLRPNKESNNL